MTISPKNFSTKDFGLPPNQSVLRRSLSKKSLSNSVFSDSDGVGNCFIFNPLDGNDFVKCCILVVRKHRIFRVQIKFIKNVFFFKYV